MTIFGTPGGTPLNTPGFQGTQPGNAVGPALQQANPGVGMFPPNSNSNSGDSVMAAVSRGALPANVLLNNEGIRDSRPGRTIHEAFGTAQANGTGALHVQNGGSPNCAPCGGNSLGAGGYNQTNGPSAGEQCIMPTSAPAVFPVLTAVPQYQG